MEIPNLRELDDPRIKRLNLTPEELGRYINTVRSGGSKDAALRSLLAGKEPTDDDINLVKGLLKNY